MVTSGWRRWSGIAWPCLSTQYCMISEKTTSLYLACQHLLEELTEVDRELGERLMVFQSSDKVAHKLTSTTLSVQSETFLALLSTFNTSMV